MEYLNPIPDCSHHNEVDNLCNHPENITPECHIGCCPRLSKQICNALEAITPSILLTEQEKGMGLMIVTCTCCGNVRKAHNMANALAFGLTPNFGCSKCQGIPPKQTPLTQ